MAILNNYTIKGNNILLILSRKTGETINIGNDVTVTVLGIKGSQVRIGVSAPRDVDVHREEIYERIQGENNGNSRRVETS